MTAARVALVHTVTALPGVFQPLCARMLPSETEVINLVDDSLLRDARAAGAVTPAIRRRLATYVWSAADAGASVVLVTCSSMGSAVDELARWTSVPLLRVDEPMAEAAIRHGDRIGVAATLATTMEPTTRLVERKAREAGRRAFVRGVVCDGAFDAGRAGDTARHDELVREAVCKLADDVDVVVLAQASMAWALESLATATPVLTSPELAVAHLADVVAATATDG